MNPNINLHIGSIVLDGIDLAPDQSQLLQQTVASQLTEMFAQQGIGSSTFYGPNIRGQHRDNSIYLGRGTEAASIGPQLASAIYTNIPKSQLGPRVTHGGQS